MSDTLSTISSIATAVAVIVAAWQLWLAHRQSVTTFEDSLAREYREIAASLPTKALLGEELSEEEYKEHFDEFYHYFDLCNEQAFLHQRGRIRRSTWKFWHDGMASNLKRPAFKRAWNEICERSNSDFSELREIFPPDAQRVSNNARLPEQTTQLDAKQPPQQDGVTKMNDRLEANSVKRK